MIFGPNCFSKMYQKYSEIS